VSEVLDVSREPRTNLEVEVAMTRRELAVTFPILLGLALAPGRLVRAEQTVPFHVTVREAPRQPAPGLHSFAIATHDGKWLLIGGRTNGFHRTSEAESTFPSRLANQYLHVVDPKNDASWKIGIPEPHRLRLRSSNMEYYQDGDYIYLAGGYGPSSDDDKPESYQTFPHLTAIRIPEIIRAIMSGNQEDVGKCIVTVADERMRVTGGGLKKLGDNFFLVFGQNYDGIYKGARVGNYTCEVRRFRIKCDGDTLAITDYAAFGDPKGPGPDSPYHRRDLNVVEALLADGALGISAYGGVFTRTAGPWVNPVHINQDRTGKVTLTLDQQFEQKVCHYDCPDLLMYDPASKTMFTTFFGGISFYYSNNEGKLEPSNIDNFMPFTSAITTIARHADGSTLEAVQTPADSLPRLLGADAVFVPVGNLQRCGGTTEILDFSKLPKADPVRVGHLYGGILASAPQVGRLNPSFANQTIYEVWVERVPGSR
jgi:hypothetical protein